MKSSIAKVRDFHKKYEFLLDGKLKNPKHKFVVTKVLNFLGERLLKEAQEMEQEAVEYRDQGDERLYRTQLMLEEFAEMIIGLASMDEEDTLDGMDDLLYTLFGTSACYDLPLEEGFNEVHRSNMTKPMKTKVDPRMRNKVGYVPPNIKGVIAAHKAKRMDQAKGARK